LSRAGVAFAFIEEQRRCGMWQLEDYSRQTAKTRSFQNRFLALKSDCLSKFKREILDSTALKVEAILSTRERNYLSFLRWLYLSGRIES
jgi:hypothetical protein